MYLLCKLLTLPLPYARYRIHPSMFQHFISPVPPHNIFLLHTQAPSLQAPRSVLERKESQPHVQNERVSKPGLHPRHRQRKVASMPTEKSTMTQVNMGLEASSQQAEGAAPDLHEQSSIQDLMWHEHGSVRGSVETRDVIMDRLGTYLRLGKFRLSALVLSTTACGFVMASAGHLLTVDSLVTLGACCVGTFFTSLAANSINQLLEIPYDSQMQRTHSRPLVTGRLTPPEAALVAMGLSVGGLGILGCAVNSVTAMLGACNLLLYTAAYTPMKRISQWNTWVGSVVGAIPPLMGWAAATNGSLEPAAWVLFALLYAWQFPHFMALSWNLRGEYSRAGYQMTSVVDPQRCRMVALRYSLLTIPICLSAPYFGLTDWMFAIDSLPVNILLSTLAWRFYKNRDSRSSRQLFRYTLVYLPLIMVLMIISRIPRQQNENKNEANHTDDLRNT